MVYGQSPVFSDLGGDYCRSSSDHKENLQKVTAEKTASTATAAGTLAGPKAAKVRMQINSKLSTNVRQQVRILGWHGKGFSA